MVKKMLDKDLHVGTSSQNTGKKSSIYFGLLNYVNMLYFKLIKELSIYKLC
ncbi:hypothetical protein BN988_01863 [Oceanobacillus picturae]|uniref:Uncharacterized protein n=1 Tax=Oceanobacillus picturae TaxID=171693 RepID=W9ACX5_9BACI|nr:hypothetical protein BN988_01863 [Oceanobacillus picturae]